MQQTLPSAIWNMCIPISGIIRWVEFQEGKEELSLWAFSSGIKRKPSLQTEVSEGLRSQFSQLLETTFEYGLRKIRKIITFCSITGLNCPEEITVIICISHQVMTNLYSLYLQARKSPAKRNVYLHITFSFLSKSQIQDYHYFNPL